MYIHVHVSTNEYSKALYTGIGYDMHDIVHTYMYDVIATPILPLIKVFVIMQLPHRGTSRQDKWTTGYQLKSAFQEVPCGERKMYAASVLGMNIC